MIVGSVTLYLTLVFVQQSFIVRVVEGVVQMCNPGLGTVVYQFSAGYCPFGILFEEPLYATCLRTAADNDVRTYFADVCQRTMYNPEKLPIVQFIPNLTETPLMEGESCWGNLTNQCNGNLIYIQADNITEPRNDFYLISEMNFEHTPEDDFNETLLLDQTTRMFRYISGIPNDNEDFVGNEIGKGSRSDEEMEGPVLRITELLNESFKVLSKHCNASFVSAQFSEDIRRMFLFLLRENYIGQLKDVTKQEFEIIQGTLKRCYQMEPVFQLKGTACRTYSKATHIQKNGRTYPYKNTEFFHSSNKYDPVVDVTWATMDFVHGLCYGTFDFHVNSHHLYQRAIERLFVEGILYRWIRPAELFKEEIWDHMLSTGTRLALHSLDVCVQGAYIDIPFLHRLKRPVDWESDLPTYNNFREGSFSKPMSYPADQTGLPSKSAVSDRDDLRSGFVDYELYDSDSTEVQETTGRPILRTTTAPVKNGITARKFYPNKKEVKWSTVERPLTLDEVGLSEVGWCFDTKEKQEEVLRNYIESHCPYSDSLEYLISVGETSDSYSLVVVDYDDYDDDREEGLSLNLINNSSP